MPRGNSLTKKAKRQIVVAAKLANKSHAEIAQEANCTQRHVDRLLAEPESELLARDLLRPHEERLRRSLAKALDAIDRGLDAALNTTHDFRAQLSAVERLKGFLELLKTNERTLGDTTYKFAGQMEQWLELYRQITTTTTIVAGQLPTKDPAAGQGGVAGPGAPQRPRARAPRLGEDDSAGSGR